MKLLGVDTSSKILALSVFENGRLIKESNSNSNARHGEGIVSAVARLMKESKTKLGDIRGFVVGVGPGSFTGLRVGVSLIKGFCLAKNVSVLPISSLDLIAYNARHYSKNICVIVDAKQEKVYGCLFKMGRSLKRISPYMLCPIGEAVKRAKKLFRGEVLFIGDGIKLYKKKISHHLKGAIFAQEDYWYPRGEALGALGWPRFGKNATKNLNKINPLYLYPKECQVRR